MDIKPSGEAGPIDDGPINVVRKHPAGKFRKSRARRINDGRRPVSSHASAPAVCRYCLARCGSLRHIVQIDGNTTAFLRSLQPGATFRHRQGVHRRVPRFLMDLQLESVFKERLQHGASHLNQRCAAFRFGVQVVEFGIEPGWSAQNPQLPGI